MEIRERRADDLDQLVAVASRVHEADGYPIFLPDGDFVRFLTRPKPTAAWVAVSDGTVVGHVALNPASSGPVMHLIAELESEPAIYVARLLVDPGFCRALSALTRSSATCAARSARASSSSASPASWNHLISTEVSRSSRVSAENHDPSERVRRPRTGPHS